MYRIGLDRGRLCFDTNDACRAGLSAPYALPARGERACGAGKASLEGGVGRGPAGDVEGSVFRCRGWTLGRWATAGSLEDRKPGAPQISWRPCHWWEASSKARYPRLCLTPAGVPGAARVRDLEGLSPPRSVGSTRISRQGWTPVPEGPLTVARLLGLLTSHALEPPFRSTDPQPVGLGPWEARGSRRCAIGL